MQAERGEADVTDDYEIKVAMKTLKWRKVTLKT